MAYNPFRDPQSAYNNPKKGPHASGAPGGGIPIKGPLSPEQEEWLFHDRRKVPKEEGYTSDDGVNLGARNE